MPSLAVVHKRLERWPVDTWLGEQAAEVVLITTHQAHAKGGNYAAFRDVVLVDDYRSESAGEAIRRAAKAHGVGRIAGCAEVDVLRLAGMRDELGLPGLSGTAALALTNKLHMRERALRAGIASPDYWDPSATEARALTRRLASGRNLIAKPREDSGSRGITAIHSPRELELWLAEHNDRLHSYVIEEFISGPLVHVDGLTIDGAVVHAWPSEYGATPLRSRQARVPLTSWMLAPTDARMNSIMAFTRKTISAMPPSPDLSAFHLELILRSPREPVFCEIGMRPAGGGSDLAWEAAFGSSPIRAHLLGQLGMTAEHEHRDSPSEFSGWSMLFPLESHVYAVPPLPGSVSVIHAGLPRAGQVRVSDGDAAGVVVLRGSSVEEVQASLRSVTNWWQSDVHWHQ